jgi:hypothetical protein
MAEIVSVYQLPRNDTEEALKLFRRLYAAGVWDEDQERTMIMAQDDPTELEERMDEIKAGKN